MKPTNLKELLETIKNKETEAPVKEPNLRGTYQNMIIALHGAMQKIKGVNKLELDYLKKNGTNN